ncbi:hypothetical protein DY000_02009339 [Brassica cretica]|uniref:Uncharacterized protein n=1 Tax=Brassica cretica TaxID=69181 RepID=A0ABQ7C9V5_BRACR|nr:hypothetical protein DY000_02009339 [Brassica cretica]
MNCARAGVENQNGCEIRTTNGTHNHHDGDDDDGDDLPGNPSALPNVGIEGNERVETSSPGTSCSGPATKKPLLSKSGQEGTKSLSEQDGVSRVSFPLSIMLGINVGFLKI